MVLIITWLFLSLLLALFLGSYRKIGFVKSLVASLLLSPIIGIVVILFSETKKNAASKKETERLSKEYLDLINPKKK